MLQNHENFHVFQLFTTDVFFNKVMHLHVRKTVLRDVYAPHFETQSALLLCDLYLEVVVKNLGVAKLWHAHFSGRSIFELIMYIIYIYICGLESSKIRAKLVFLCFLNGAKVTCLWIDLLLFFFKDGKKHFFLWISWPLNTCRFSKKRMPFNFPKKVYL